MSENVANFPVTEHNEGAEDSRDVAAKRLTSFIERIERLEEEKAALMEDIKEVYGEAKGVGFDVKTIRKVVALRKMDVEKRREADELLDLYKSAVGIVQALYLFYPYSFLFKSCCASHRRKAVSWTVCMCKAKRFQFLQL